MFIAAACASNQYVHKDRNAEQMRIIDTLSRLQPGKVPAKDIIMADYQAKRTPKVKAPFVKTPKVENAIIDKIEHKSIDEIESHIPGHHKNEEENNENDDSSKFDIDMSTIEGIGSERQRGEPKHHIMGFTEYDVIDFMEGFATGIYHKDVTEEYETCVLGAPRYAMEMYNISKSIKINQLNSLSGLEENF
jgi:hypothetical protein